MSQPKQPLFGIAETHRGRVIIFAGGIPLKANGQVVGAVGVSGASSADEDQELATVGAGALAGGSNGRAAFFSGDLLFERGGIVLDAGRYKIDAGRRNAPGAPELHEREVDVMRVVQGQATIVTGGEIRGDRIEGGTVQALAEGDVIAIPSGVPHQFVDVSDPFLYFVVKVEA